MGGTRVQPLADSTVPASQPLPCCQVPETTLPASQPWALQQADPMASLSTQTPSNLAPTPSSQSNAQ